MRAKCICIEGADFSGKTTIVGCLERYFKQKGLDVKVYRQPGATPLGADIRKTLFDRGFDDMNVWAERMLFSAEHADFVAKVLRQDAPPNRLIICDRYNPLSNMIYGHLGRGLDFIKMKALNDIAGQGYCPDKIFVLDISKETMLERMEKRQADKGEINRIDLEDMEFKDRILAGYTFQSEDFISTREASKVELVDGNRPVEWVFADIVERVKSTISFS